MLTVWRRLHIEVDSMENVFGNNLTGTITRNSLTVCPSPPGNCTVNRFFAISNTQVEQQRFDGGRIITGVQSLPVLTNILDPNTNNQVVVLAGNPVGSSKIRPGMPFTLYDDDDYNLDDGTTLDGDIDESIIQLPDSLRYLSPNDGVYSNNTPMNVLGNAYIRPDYSWAAGRNYNQSNVVFNLNIENIDATIRALLNSRRDSVSDKRDDFWIGYFIVGYQGPLLEDFDGISGNNSENAIEGITLQTTITSLACDCYNSPNCPTGGVVWSTLPVGAIGSIVYQETIQDLVRYFTNPPPPLPSRQITDVLTTTAHEVGHQFGLKGDEKRTTFKLMDYPDYLNGATGPVVGFHEEHINIMRRRVKSPGQQ